MSYLIIYRVNYKPTNFIIILRFNLIIDLIYYNIVMF